MVHDFVLDLWVKIKHNGTTGLKLARWPESDTFWSVLSVMLKSETFLSAVGASGALR